MTTTILYCSSGAVEVDRTGGGSGDSDTGYHAWNSPNEAQGYPANETVAQGGGFGTFSSETSTTYKTEWLWLPIDVGPSSIGARDKIVSAVATLEFDMFRGTSVNDLNFDLYIAVGLTSAETDFTTPQLFRSDVLTGSHTRLSAQEGVTYPHVQYSFNLGDYFSLTPAALKNGTWGVALAADLTSNGTGTQFEFQPNAFWVTTEHFARGGEDEVIHGKAP